MNLIDNISENTIYKIKVWKSISETQTYVFVGKEPKEKIILNKLFGGKHLSSSEEETLIKAYGKNFKKKLALGEKHKKLIFDQLHNDDNINTIRKKVAMYIFAEKSENDLYLWMERSVAHSGQFKYGLATQLLQGKKKAYKDDILASLSFYYGQEIKTSNDSDKLDLKSIMELQQQIKTEYVNECLGAKYLRNQFVHYYQINPFKCKGFTQASEYEIISDRSITMEWYQIKGNTINVALYDDVYHENKEAVDFYFPWHDKTTVTVNNDVFKSSDMIYKQTTDMIDRLDHDDFNVECHINYLHLRINDFNQRQKDLDLQYIFEKFETDNNVPFIKYNSNTNKKYKINKDALSAKSMRKISKDDFDTWTEVNPAEAQKSNAHEYILFKLYIKSFDGVSKYISILLFADTHIDLKYNVKSTEHVSLEEITDNFILLNSVLSKIQYISDIHNFNIPKLTKNVWTQNGSVAEIKIVKVATYVQIVSKSAQNVKLHDIKLLSASLFPFVSVVEYEREKDSMAILQYKRIDNYVKTDNITVFLNRNTSHNKNELIHKIQEEFGLSQKEASNEYDRWLTSQKVELVPVGNGLYFRPMNANNVIIKMKQSSLGYKILIDGITQIKYHRRIVNLLKFIIFFSAKANLKKIGFIKMVDEQDKNQYDNDMYTEDNIDRNDEFAVIEDVIEGNDEFIYDHDNLEEELDLDFGELDLTEIEEIQEDNLEDANDKEDKIVYNEEDQIKKLEKSPDTFQYVLNKLKAADKKVFQGNNYSTKCQWSNRRQPIIISNDDKVRIDKEYPGSYDDNFIKFGTDAEKMKKNIYICPEIWCPISRVSMTYEQFLKNGKKCPTSEPVIDLTNDFWRDEDGTRKARFIGFTGTGEKECLPCCFKIKPEVKKGKPNKNQKKIDQCVQNMSDVKPSVKPSVKSVSDKYIVGKQFPLDAGRYGILPKPVSLLFRNKKCGNGGEGTGLIVEGIDCFVRRGIHHQHNLSLFSCMSLLLLKNQDTDLVKLIKENLQMDTFLLSNDGGLCGVFIDESRSIFDPKEFSEFRKWFLNMPTEYISTFNLFGVRDDIDKHSGHGFKKDNLKNYTNFKHILREYIIYNSYTNFLKYLEDTTIQKHHDVFLDIFNQRLNWLNPNRYNVIILESENDSYYMSCPRDFLATVDLSRPFIFVMKQGSYYEPIFRVRQQSNESVHSDFTFDYKEDEIIKNIVDFYKKNCRIKNNNNAKEVFTYLNTTGHTVKYQVINYNYKLEGFIVKPGLFVPCKPQNPIIMKNAWYIYIDDMIRKVVPANWVDIKHTLSSLYELTREKMYKIHKVISVGKDAVGIITETGSVIPLVKRKFPIERYLDNLNIFIGWEDEDERKIFVDDYNNKELLYKILKNEILNVVSNNIKIKQEVEFLTSVDNPIPLSFRKTKMDVIIRKFMTRFVYEVENIKHIEIDRSRCNGLSKQNCNGICSWVDMTDKQSVCKIKVPTKWLESFIQKISVLVLHNRGKYETIDIRRKKTNEVVFQQKEVREGKTTKFYEILQNPYMFVDKVVDDYVKNIVEDQVKVKKNITIKTILTNEWKNLPKKFNKAFNGKQEYDTETEGTFGFSVNVQQVNKPQFFYELCYFLKKLVASHLKLSETTFNQIIYNRTIEDYKSDINLTDDLKRLNPHFAYLAKERTNSKTLSLQEIIEIMGLKQESHTGYIMSEYELKIIANLLNIKIIIIGRQTIRNPNEIKCIKPRNTTDKFIILFQNQANPLKKVYHDQYDIVARKTKGHPEIVFYNSDHPVLADYIDKTCVKWFVLES